MLNVLKLNFFSYVIKVLKWLVGQDFDASPWGLGFKLWWMCMLMYILCIYIDVSYKYSIWTCTMVVNGLLLTKIQMNK